MNINNNINLLNIIIKTCCLINNENCGSSNIKRVDVNRKGKYCEEYSANECPTTDYYGYKCIVKDSACKGKCEEYSTESPCKSHASCKWDIYHCVYDDNYEASSSTSSTNNSKKTVLLIGNSKTIGTKSSNYNNSVKTKLSGFLKAGGYNYDIQLIAVASEKLSTLYNNYKSKLTSNKYDYVVMQEHTTELFELDTYKRYVNLISNAVKKKNSNVKTYVRAVWVYKNKNKTNRKYTTAKSNTEIVASKIGATVIYDGKALYAAGDINVFESDNKHQNANGAYLSAACIYKSLTGENPTSSTYGGGLSNYKQLQKIANNNC